MRLNPVWALLALCALAACERSPVSPADGPIPTPFLPTFAVLPGGAPSNTSCADGDAFLRNPVHLTSLDADFFPAGSSTERTTCGAILFNEGTNDSGAVRLRLSVLPSILGHWETWGRRLRNALNGGAPETFHSEGSRMVRSLQFSSWLPGS